MAIAWDPDFAERAPAFAPLVAVARELQGASFPECNDVNRMLAARDAPICNASGMPLRFVAQSLRQSRFEDKYEPRVFLRGEVQLRPGNWHDLFNALVWLTYPQAKAALNARHFHALERRRAEGARNRGPAQDALTLFDEGGVIVATADPALGALLAGFEWKELFWRRRAEVVERMRFYLFGHALYEKALQPFTGVTGRGVLFEVAPVFLNLPLARQLNEIDVRLAARIADPALFLGTRQLTPVPFLGIPGWCPDNEREQYYDNTGYFRPPASARAGGN